MRLDSVYNELGLPLYIADLESYEIIYINKKGKELFGDITGKKCYEELNGSSDLCKGCCSGKCLQEKGSLDTKLRYLTKVKKYVDTYETMIDVENGKKARLCVLLDRTSEYEMDLTNRYQLAIIESSANYIGVSDLEGNTIYHSPGAYRLIGYEPGEIDVWTIKNSHPDWYLKKVLEEGIPTAIKEGQWVGRGEVINRYGENVLVEQTIFPVFDKEKNIMGVATIIQDMTNQVKKI